MVTPNFTGLLTHLREAQFQLYESEYNGSHTARERALEHVIEALTIAEAALEGQRCEGPECGAPLEYSGVGRPPRYCGKRCRDRAAYRAKRQRTQREG